MPPKKKARKVTDNEYRELLLVRLENASTNQIGESCPLETANSQNYSFMINCYLEYSYKSNTFKSALFTFYNTRGNTNGLQLWKKDNASDDQIIEENDNQPNLPQSPDNDFAINIGKISSQLFQSMPSNTIAYETLINLFSDIEGIEYYNADINNNIPELIKQQKKSTLKNVVIKSQTPFMTISSSSNSSNSSSNNNVSNSSSGNNSSSSSGSSSKNNNNASNTSSGNNSSCSSSSCCSSSSSSSNNNIQIILRPFSSVTNDSSACRPEDDASVIITCNVNNYKQLGEAIIQRSVVALNREEAKLHPDGKYHGERMKWADV